MHKKLFSLLLSFQAIHQECYVRLFLYFILYKTLNIYFAMVKKYSSLYQQILLLLPTFFIKRNVYYIIGSHFLFLTRALGTVTH